MKLNEYLGFLEHIRDKEEEYINDLLVAMFLGIQVKDAKDVDQYQRAIILNAQYKQYFFDKKGQSDGKLTAITAHELTVEKFIQIENLLDKFTNYHKILAIVCGVEATDVLEYDHIKGWSILCWFIETLSDLKNGYPSLYTNNSKDDSEGYNINGAKNKFNRIYPGHYQMLNFATDSKPTEIKELLTWNVRDFLYLVSYKIDYNKAYSND